MTVQFGSGIEEPSAVDGVGWFGFGRGGAGGLLGLFSFGSAHWRGGWEGRGGRGRGGFHGFSGALDYVGKVVLLEGGGGITAHSMMREGKRQKESNMLEII